MIEVPPSFVESTVRREGEPGLEWARSLPTLVDELAVRWACTPTGPVAHGFVAVVVPVRRADGTDAVLKVSWTHPGNVPEPRALAAWGGHGAVRLLERDDERFAMLLERLSPDSLDMIGSPLEGVAVAGRLAKRLAVPAPEDVPALADVVATWEAELVPRAERLGGNLPRRILDAAVATARELRGDQPNTLVHGDLHFHNVLRGEREPWLAIDPKGWAGDRCYDGLTVLRSRWRDLADEPDFDRALRLRLDVFADAAEVDQDRARRWAQLRAVVEGQWSREYREPDFVVAVCDEIASVLAD